jgi:hypothetical protein
MLWVVFSSLSPLHPLRTLFASRILLRQTIP